MGLLDVRESNLVMIHYVLVLVRTGLELDHMELEWGMKHGKRGEVDHRGLFIKERNWFQVSCLTSPFDLRRIPVHHPGGSLS